MCARSARIISVALMGWYGHCQLVQYWALGTRTGESVTVPRSTPLHRPPGHPTLGRPSSLPKWPSWFLLGWWILALGIVDLSGFGGAGAGTSAVETGSLTRMVLVLAFGAAGALRLPDAIRKLDRAGWRLLTFLGAYLGWASLSLVWSESLQLTIRRLVLTTMLIVGALGLGAGYYGQSEKGREVLARDLLVAGIVAGASAWISKLIRGEVDLLAGNWALVPFGVGTAIGYPLLLAGLVSVFGRHTNAIPNPFASRRTQGVVLMGVWITIISLRKRTLLAVTALATGFLSFVFRRRRARGDMLVRLGVGLSIVVIFVALLGIDITGDITGTATSIVTRGDQELDLESLTGRVPLWEELAARASERPWTGVGFGAYWTPERMADIESAVGWPAVTAHNGYIDEILATGLPGLVLLLGAWVTAIVNLARRASKRRDAFALLGAVWVGCYLLLNLGEALMQNFLNFPFYSALVLAFAAFSSSSSINVPSAELH